MWSIKLSRYFLILLNLSLLVLFLCGCCSLFSTPWPVCLATLGANFVLTLLCCVYLLQQGSNNYNIVFFLFSSIILPFIGNLLFSLVGYVGFAQEEKRYNHVVSDKHQLPPLFFFNQKVGGSVVSKNSEFNLIASKTLLREISKLIKEAKTTIYVEFYIFWGGYVSDYLIQLLKAKASEGVDVRILVDHLGSFRKLETHRIKDMKSRGIKFLWFNHFLKNSLSAVNSRSHNKMIIVDNERVLFGSGNISDDSFLLPHIKAIQSNESFLLCKGTIVNSFSDEFLKTWELNS